MACLRCCRHACLRHARRRGIFGLSLLEPTCVAVSRIFGTLAAFVILMMAATMALGLSVDLNGRVQQIRVLVDRMRTLEAALPSDAVTSEELATVRQEIQELQVDFKRQRRTSSIHMLLGVATALFIVLVSSIAVTYFVGTSRWCREVVETYNLDTTLIAESQTLKRRAFPWAVTGMLTAVGVSALGAASDPGTGNPQTGAWVTPHLAAAIAGICLVGCCFYVLWNHIASNHVVIERVMQHVQNVRESKGLTTRDS